MVHYCYNFKVVSGILPKHYVTVQYHRSRDCSITLILHQPIRDQYLGYMIT